MATNTKGKKGALQGKDEVFYIVNPAGAVHTVDRDHCKYRLRQVGYRLATEDEIKAYQSQRVQRPKNPIAPPWSPEPDVDITLPDEATDEA